MSHPDEGTIHAWLDGELSVTEAQAFEERVASDPALQAAVAEARGLMAASSRILGALDGVPGGVLPSAGGSAPTLEAARMRSARLRRWSAQRWAVAATILVAVGVGVLYNASDRSVRSPGGAAALQQAERSVEAQRVVAMPAPSASPAAPVASAVAARPAAPAEMGAV